MRVLHEFLLSALAGLVVTAASPAKGSESGPLPPAGVSRSHPAVVRVDLYRGYLIVARGSIGPLKGLHFLLDTGATPTVLDPRLAQKLHLEQQPAGIAVLGGRVQGARSMAPSLEFGPIRAANVPVLIEDLSFLEKALPVHIDAMIGLDVLGHGSFVIDYASRAIGFGPAPPLPVSIPLRVKDGLAIVDAEVNHAPVRLLVDTGASSLILFETGMPGSVSGLGVSAVRRSTN
ncbi:MAG TPA: aspartyl protease family protein, partial [Acidobacteriaceae bacterium]|nr:aspartyl protease family protein [Acidobacteriaceae bacterium]